MPGIAFPAWWSINNDKINNIYREYNLNRPDWSTIKKEILNEYKEIDRRFVSRYCGQFRGDPVYAAYAGLIGGVIETMENDPLLLFPSIAIYTLDEEECSNKANELLEILEKAQEGDFSFLRSIGNKFRPYSEFAVNNFHPMVVEGVGCAIGTMLVRNVASKLSNQDLVNICRYGDKLYAKSIAGWADEIADQYDRISEDLIRLITEERTGSITIQTDRVVPMETLQILSNSLNKLADIVEKKPVKVMDGVYLVKGEGGSHPSVKTKSEMNSKKLLKSAISRLKKL